MQKSADSFSSVTIILNLKESTQTDHEHARLDKWGLGSTLRTRSENGPKSKVSSMMCLEYIKHKNVMFT